MHDPCSTPETALAAAPELRIPPNCRMGTHTRLDAFLLSARLSLSPLLLTVLYTLYCIAVSIWYLYGIFELFEYEAHVYAVVPLGVLALYEGLNLINLAVMARNNPLHGRPICYGFTEDVYYVANALQQTVQRWELFGGWKERRRFFLLLSQGSWLILPKTIWSAEEQEELRRILRRKVGRRPGKDRGPGKKPERQPEQQGPA